MSKFRLNKKKIIITGGDGRFANVLKKINSGLSFVYPNKKELNILDFNKIIKYLRKSGPMSVHDKNISKSIDLNIIGTANIVKACERFNIKLIYFSTNYVYEGTKGNYSEQSPLLPINSYAWSKLGGECSVKLYKNSLILRICMCEKPFIHKYAFFDVKTNFIFQEDIAKIIPKILHKKGILNIGGDIQTVYSFAKKHNSSVKKKSGKGIFPLNPSIDISKFKEIISKKR